MEASREEILEKSPQKSEDGVIAVVQEDAKNPYQTDLNERDGTAINDMTEDTNQEDEKVSLDSNEIGQKEEQIEQFVTQQLSTSQEVI